jgi:protoporphyrinogen oxidase
MDDRAEIIVLGAGMSALGAALSLRAPAFEATVHPGGLCHSIYLDDRGVLHDPTVDDTAECFRFEPAGGHWLFCRSDATLDRLGSFSNFRRYQRRAAAYFVEDSLLVPFPVQDNLRYFNGSIRDRILREILSEREEACADLATFQEWLLLHFGGTLCELFFFPFNERYTSGLYSVVGPQDRYKTPIDRERVLEGSLREVPDIGYNAEFYYPENGLDCFTRAIASLCSIRYGHRAVAIDAEARQARFTNGVQVRYRELVSTIPLNDMLTLCGLDVEDPADPATACLVVNIAAYVGVNCPAFHWVYVPKSRSGLHRVGFYSHVDSSFLPRRHRAGRGSVVSLYAERSYPTGSVLSDAEISKIGRAIATELQEWGFISDVITTHSALIDPAYTWSWPGSKWVRNAKEKLATHGIHQIGRFGAWRFQGMATSFEEGWLLGKKLSVAQAS